MHFWISIIAIVSVLLFTGCSSSSSDGGGAPGDSLRDPQKKLTISEVPINKYPRMTSAQAAKIKASYSLQNEMPTQNLILYPENETFSDRDQRLRKINALPAIVRSRLDMINRMCAIHPTKIETTGKGGVGETSQITGKGSVEADINHANCPVTITDIQDSKMTILSMDQKSSSLKMSLSAVLQKSFVVNDSNLSAATNWKSLTSTYSPQGIIHFTNGKRLSFMASTVALVGTPQRGPSIKVTGVIKSQQEDSDVGSVSRTAISLDFSVEDAIVNVVVFSEGDGSKISTDETGKFSGLTVLINGENATAQDLVDLFGDTRIIETTL